MFLVKENFPSTVKKELTADAGCMFLEDTFARDSCVFFRDSIFLWYEGYLLMFGANLDQMGLCNQLMCCC